MADKDQGSLKLRFCEFPSGKQSMRVTGKFVLHWGSVSAQALPSPFLMYPPSLPTPSLLTSTSVPPTHSPLHELYLSFLPHPFLE